MVVAVTYSPRGGQRLSGRRLSVDARVWHVRTQSGRYPTHVGLHRLFARVDF